MRAKHFLFFTSLIFFLSHSLEAAEGGVKRKREGTQDTVMQLFHKRPRPAVKRGPADRIPHKLEIAEIDVSQLQDHNEPGVTSIPTYCGQCWYRIDSGNMTYRVYLAADSIGNQVSGTADLGAGGKREMTIDIAMLQALPAQDHIELTGKLHESFTPEVYDDLENFLLGASVVFNLGDHSYYGSVLDLDMEEDDDNIMAVVRSRHDKKNYAVRVQDLTVIKSAGQSQL